MPPVQQPNIDAELLYILDNWYQNTNQLIKGQIGQNVVYNLGLFIKQNPENWNRASVVTTPNVDYIATKNECIIIFTSNSAGSIDYTTNPNIWNKYYIINATDNVRTLFGNGYLDINGVQQTEIPARSGIYIAKGNDDFWYQIAGLGGGSSSKYPLIGVVGGGTVNDPVNGTSVFQSDRLIGLAQANNQRCQIEIDGGILQNFGSQISFILDNVTGEIDISPNTFVTDQTLYIDLNQ